MNSSSAIETCSRPRITPKTLVCHKLNCCSQDVTIGVRFVDGGGGVTSANVNPCPQIIAANLGGVRKTFLAAGTSSFGYLHFILSAFTFIFFFGCAQVADPQCFDRANFTPTETPYLFGDNRDCSLHPNPHS